MWQTAYVCPKCLKRHPTKYKCVDPSRHDQRSLRAQQDGLSVHQPICPVSDLPSVRRFILCFYFPRCKKGDSCTYAHSEAERDAWNRGHGHEQIQYSNPSRSSGAPHYNPQQRHTSSETLSPPPQQPTGAQPQPRTKRPASQGPPLESHPLDAQALRIDCKPLGHSQKPPQPAIPQLALNEGGAQPLTPGNYQYKFSELIRLEEESHAEILEKRCNGKFELVYEGKLPEDPQRIGAYLLGISGDNAAYVTQACDHEGVSISYKHHEIRAAISFENYHHLEDVLYINFDEEAFNKCFPTASRWSVLVKFILKRSYFSSLQCFIKFLSPEVIQRLLPDPQQFTSFQLNTLDDCYESLFLELCSEDQRFALATVLSSPPAGPPILVTGAFGTGKTHILALAAHYYLRHSIEKKQQARILVCTQQHTSAEAFMECLMSLLVPIPEKAYVVRVTYREMGYAPPIYSKSLDDFVEEHRRRPPGSNRPYLVVTTCQTTHRLKKSTLPKGFFTHILQDNGAQMREPEAVAPLCFADANTKIVIAGDKQQVGPDLLVLGEQPREKGFSVSLLERLEKHYQQVGGNALYYIVRLVTNYRCHKDIMSLSEKLFYKSFLKSEVPVESTHPKAKFPLIFVCSSISPPQPGENPVNELEARVVIEQMSKYAPGWPRDRWGAKLDPSQICILSPSRSQVVKIKELLNSKGMEVVEKLKQVQMRPTYDMQGREYRALFLSTFEATHEDGSTRNPTKSIADPYIFNTVVTRARSLVVSVGNPYQLLKMEEHMGRKYGEKGKCWSNYLKRCLDNNTLTIHEIGPDAEKQIFQLKTAVQEYYAKKYRPEENTGTSGYDSSLPLMEDSAESEMVEEELDIPKTYTGRLERDFRLGHLLGEGTFAHVYRVRNKFDRGIYAIKIVDLPKEKMSRKKILREVRGLRKLDQPIPHKNIVRYYDSWIDMAPTDDRSKESPWKDIVSSSTATSTSTTVSGIHTTGAPMEGTLCLLIRTELCGSTLEKWLDEHKDQKTRKRSTLFSYFEQILKAITYIHEKNLAHRDLSPSNILFSLDNKEVVKVGDFGLVTGNLSSGSSDHSSRRQVSFRGMYGHELYMSPELLEHSRCTEKVDIYSLGVIYFEMNYMFTTRHEKNEELRELRTGIPQTFCTNLPKETVVIQKMMTHDPVQRPSAEFILRSKFFEDLRNAVEKEPFYIPKM